MEATTAVEASSTMEAAASVDANASSIDPSAAIDPAAAIPVNTAPAVPVNRPASIAINAWPAVVAPVEIPPTAAIRAAVKAKAAAASRLGRAYTELPLLERARV